MTSSVAASAPSAPAAPPSSGDSVSVGVRQHAPPSRASRSEREAAASVAGRAPGREARKPDEMEALRAKLVEDADAEPGDADAPLEADDAQLEGDEPQGEGEGEAADGDAQEPPEVAQLRGQLQEAQAHVAEVREAATATLRENQRLERYVDFLKQAIGSFRLPDGTTLELDPRELELFELRTEKELGAVGQELTAKQQQAEHERAVASETKRLRGEIDAEAKKAGVDAKDLAKRYAFAVMHHDGRGPEPTIADVIAEMRAVADHRQRATSAKAPRLKGGRGSTAAIPKPPKTVAGVRQFLQSQGFAAD